MEVGSEIMAIGLQSDILYIQEHFYFSILLFPLLFSMGLHSMNCTCAHSSEHEDKEKNDGSQ